MSNASLLFLCLDAGARSVRAAPFGAASQAAGPFAEEGATGKSRIPTMWSKSTLIVWL